MNGTVTIKIRKPYIADFVRSQFKTKIGDPVKLSRHNPIGRMIYCKTQNISYPKQRDASPEDMIFILPENEFNSKYHFHIISREDEEKINDYIEEYCDMIFNKFMLVCEKIGLPYKKGIDIFLFQNKIRIDTVTTDAFKKNEYRFRIGLINDIYNTMQNPDFTAYSTV